MMRVFVWECEDCGYAHEHENGVCLAGENEE